MNKKKTTSSVRLMYNERVPPKIKLEPKQNNQKTKEKKNMVDEI